MRMSPLRWILLVVSTMAITMCGTPDIPTAQDPISTAISTPAPTLVPSPPPSHSTLDYPTTPTFTPDPAQPTIDPATPTFPPEPTDTSMDTPEPTLNPTDAKATVVADATEQAAYTFAHLPPTSAVPLVQSLGTLGPHTLLYGDTSLLQAYDVDSGASIWLTAPAPTHRCNTDSDGGEGESGRWSPDGQYILVSCAVAERSSVALLPLAIGKLYELSAIRPDDKANQITDESGIWLPSGHQCILASRLTEHNQLQATLVDAATRVLKPLPEMENAEPVAGAPRGKAIAFLRTQDGSPTGQFFLRKPDGSVHQLLTDSYVELFTWMPDGRALDVARKTQVGGLETVRVDVATGAVTLLAPYAQRLIWSPDGRRYLAQGIHPDKTIMPWEIHAADGTLERTLPGTYAEARWMRTRRQRSSSNQRTRPSDDGTHC